MCSYWSQYSHCCLLKERPPNSAAGYQAYSHATLCGWTTHCVGFASCHLLIESAHIPQIFIRLLCLRVALIILPIYNLLTVEVTDKSTTNIKGHKYIALRFPQGATEQIIEALRKFQTIGRKIDTQKCTDTKEMSLLSHCHQAAVVQEKDQTQVIIIIHNLSAKRNEVYSLCAASAQIRWHGYQRLTLTHIPRGNEREQQIRTSFFKHSPPTVVTHALYSQSDPKH